MKSQKIELLKKLTEQTEPQRRTDYVCSIFDSVDWFRRRSKSEAKKQKMGKKFKYLFVTFFKINLDIFWVVLF